MRNKTISRFRKRLALIVALGLCLGIIGNFQPLSAEAFTVTMTDTIPWRGGC